MNQQFGHPAHDDEQQQEAALLLLLLLLLLQKQQYSKAQDYQQQRLQHSECMHVKLTSRLLRQHLNNHLTYFYAGTTNKSEMGAQNKKAIRDLNHGRRSRRDSDLPATPLYFLYR